MLRELQMNDDVDDFCDSGQLSHRLEGPGLLGELHLQAMLTGRGGGSACLSCGVSFPREPCGAGQTCAHPACATC